MFSVERRLLLKQFHESQNPFYCSSLPNFPSDIESVWFYSCQAPWILIVHLKSFIFFFKSGVTITW